jgi:hypothetical protein
MSTRERKKIKDTNSRAEKYPFIYSVPAPGY